MRFPGRFRDSLVDGKLDHISLSFLVDELEIRRGGVGGNIAFGMGGALLQAIDRDTQKFAMKCSSVQINGEWVDVQKDPITDSGKKSKAGRVQLWKSGGEWVTDVKQPTGWFDKAVEPFVPVLEEVYRDGKLVKEIKFEQK